jgi:hypothetical protein
MGRSWTKGMSCSLFVECGWKHKKGLFSKDSGLKEGFG